MSDKSDVIRQFLESHIHQAETQISLRSGSSDENSRVVCFFEGRLGALREVMDFLSELEGVDPRQGFLH